MAALEPLPELDFADWITFPESSPEPDPAVRIAAQEPFPSEPLPERDPERAFLVGHHVLTSTQLNYVIVTLFFGALQRMADLGLVLTYKWPYEFRDLSEQDILGIIEWLRSNFIAPDQTPTSSLPGDLATQRISPVRYRSSECIDFDCVRKINEKWAGSGRDMVIQIENAFGLELRDAEITEVHRQAERMYGTVGQFVCAQKLFLRASDEDVSLALTYRFCLFTRYQKHVWMIPFTAEDVRQIHTSTRSQMGSIWRFAHDMSLDERKRKKASKKFREYVDRGRQTMETDIDPRWLKSLESGIGTSAANFVELVVQRFSDPQCQGHDISGILE